MDAIAAPSRNGCRLIGRRRDAIRQDRAMRGSALRGGQDREAPWGSPAALQPPARLKVRVTTAVMAHRPQPPPAGRGPGRLACTGQRSAHRREQRKRKAPARTAYTRVIIIREQ